jgi:hypothetical protein
VHNQRYSPGLKELVRTAERRRDADGIAVAAMHSEDPKEGQRLADEAVTLDPQLTWVYYSLAISNANSPTVGRWTARLQAWDPDNAIPYLLQAQDALPRRGMTLDELNEERPWRVSMEKAFSALRYDSYVDRRFALERKVFRQYGLDQPFFEILSVAGYPIPSLLGLNLYGDLVMTKLGREAEEAGRLQDALSYYWTVAHFGERMQLGGATDLEKLMATSLQTEAYERLAPLLRKHGRAEEAATVDYARQQLHQLELTFRQRHRAPLTTGRFWNSVQVNFFLWLVVAAAAVTFLSFAYVGIQQLIRPLREGALGRFLRAGHYYAPILLFLGCLGLYLSYFPFAQAFAQAVDPRGLVETVGSLWLAMSPYTADLGVELTPLRQLFWPYYGYALIGVGLLWGSAKLIQNRVLGRERRVYADRARAHNQKVVSISPVSTCARFGGDTLDHLKALRHRQLDHGRAGQVADNIQSRGVALVVSPESRTALHHVAAEGMASAFLCICLNTTPPSPPRNPSAAPVEDPVRIRREKCFPFGPQACEPPLRVGAERCVTVPFVRSNSLAVHQVHEVTGLDRSIADHAGVPASLVPAGPFHLSTIRRALAATGFGLEQIAASTRVSADSAGLLPRSHKRPTGQLAGTPSATSWLRLLFPRWLTTSTKDILEKPESKVIPLLVGDDGRGSTQL